MTTGSDIKSYSSVLRPSERVMRFLEDEVFQRHDKQAGTLRLPTIKEVSTHLDVSVSTVQSVFAQLAKQNRVITIPGKGTFLKDEHNTDQLARPHRQTISVIIHEGELTGVESTWGKEICAGILREASRDHADKLRIQTFFSNIHGNNPEAVHSEIEYSSAAIVFPSEFSAKVATEFQNNGKPVIHITPESFTSTDNFTGPDFFNISKDVATSWRTLQKKHVALLLHHVLSDGSTCLLTLCGIQSGLQDEQGNCDTLLSYQSLDATKPDQTAQYLESLFQKKPYPDAIYTTGDSLAYQAIDWLLARGIRIPEEVSIIGGTGLHPSHNASISCTVIQQPFEEIGRTAVRMAVNAIENNLSQPGRFIPAAVRIGKTTDHAENLLLARL